MARGLTSTTPPSEHPDRGCVAGRLSKVYRFGALQASKYFSVAQHTLLVRRLVMESGYPELALATLHHDSHEAYLCDIPKPLKRKVSADTDFYDEACKTLDRMIAEAFGFEVPKEDSQEKAIIKRADDRTFVCRPCGSCPTAAKPCARTKKIRT